MKDFDEKYWENNLKHADWYIKLENELNKLIFPIVHGDPILKAFRHKVYELMEGLLEKGEIPLAPEGPNFDMERKPIDTIIIHHTEEEPDIRFSKLSAIGLVRQYALKYLQNDILGYQLKSQPIWSGHFRNGAMVFFSYHWLVRPDGSAERLLEDKYIGWHSGIWDINTRSIAVAFSGNYEESVPPIPQIKGVAEIIKKHYPQITKDRVFGHREVKEGRICPGAYFLSDWKTILLNLI